MIKHDILSILHTVLYFGPELLILNIICSVKIFQIQMSRAALSHSLWFQHKPFRFRIHNIEHGLFIIKSFRKRFVKRIISILHIKSSNFLLFLHDRAFEGIRPCPHVIHIGMGNRQPFYHAARKIQSLFGKNLSRTGNSFRFARTDERNFYHRLILLIRSDIIFRFLPQGNFLCHQLLKLRFFI